MALTVQEKKVSGKQLALSDVEVRIKLTEQNIQIKKIKKRSISSFEKNEARR